MLNQSVSYLSCQDIFNDDKIIKSDLAAEFPIYLYLSEDKTLLIYSKSLKGLLASQLVKKPLVISPIGVSFILQKGVVPPPRSIYENIFIVSIGDEVLVSVRSGQLHLSFTHRFPFMNSSRSLEDEMNPDEEHILYLLADATVSRMKNDQQSFLFHSAGKDSNMIALAMAEAGFQSKLTLISHRSKGQNNESDISKKIANRLGFKHLVLLEPTKVDVNILDLLDRYFSQVTIPVFDKVTLAQPIYSLQVPELCGSNLIDGGGNDVYMSTPPTRAQKYLFRTSGLRQVFRPFVQGLFSSTSHMNPITASKFDWCGFYGYMFADAKQIYKQAVDVRPYCVEQEQIRKGWDAFDFKTDLLTTMLAAEMHIRKFRTVCEFLNSNAILPFANKRIAEYFSKIPEVYLFDRRSLKNKLIFRKMLYERIGLDSDSLGKLGYSFDFYSFLKMLGSSVDHEILSCRLWNRECINAEIYRLRAYGSLNNLIGHRANVLLHRLFLISFWANKNKYVN